MKQLTRFAFVLLALALAGGCNPSDVPADEVADVQMTDTEKPDADTGSDPDVDEPDTDEPDADTPDTDEPDVCTPDCYGKECGADGCGGECGPVCPGGAACEGGSCAEPVDPCDGMDCNDGNFCTDDACVAGVCEYTPNTKPCDDENPCTENDTCGANACQGSVTVCDDGDACTSDSCSVSGGGCQFEALVCDDQNSNTQDSCNPTTGCVHTPIDTPCVPESVVQTCNGLECGEHLNNCGTSVLCGTCAAGSVCVAGTCEIPPPECTSDEECITAGDPTTVGFCAGGKCQVDLAVQPQCEENSDCGGEPCVEKQCVLPDPPACSSSSDCDDSNTCTSDTCQMVDGEWACTYTPIACSDGKSWTNDSCLASVGCQYSLKPGMCESNSHCNADQECELTTHTCVAKPPVCVPDCGGKECGADGCGGNCGNCSGGAACFGGQCQFLECAIDANCSDSDGMACSLPYCSGGQCFDGGLKVVTCAANHVCVEKPALAAGYECVHKDSCELVGCPSGYTCEPDGSCQAPAPPSGVVTYTADIQANTDLYGATLYGWWCLDAEQVEPSAASGWTSLVGCTNWSGKDDEDSGGDAGDKSLYTWGKNELLGTSLSGMFDAPAGACMELWVSYKTENFAPNSYYPSETNVITSLIVTPQGGAALSCITVTNGDSGYNLSCCP